MATDMNLLKSSISAEDEKRLARTESLMRLKAILEKQRFQVVEELQNLHQSYLDKGYDSEILLQLEGHIDRIDSAFSVSQEKIKLAQFQVMSQDYT